MTDAEQTPVSVPEETKLEVETEVEGPDLSGLLFDYPDSPDKAQIEEWKALYGDVLCSGFSETELYVFRPLTRVEWVVLQMQQQKGEQVDQEDYVVNSCLLWGTDIGKKSLASKAGSLSTLYEQVMQQSNFVNPAMAAALVVKL